MKTYTLIAFSMLLLSLPPTRISATTDSARNEIETQSRSFMDALEKGDAAAAARTFTADAKIIISGMEGAIAGREAIEGFWRKMAGSGMRRLVLDAHELEGDGNLRFESGKYSAFGLEGQALAHGQYLIVWKREDRAWKIHRDIASAAPQPSPAPEAVAGVQPAAPDRVGFPANYRGAFKLLGTAGGEKEALVHTAYANAAAAAVLDGSPLPFPNGAVIAMEFANPLKDGEGQLLRDKKGIPLPGEIVRVDVMRREAGYGANYGESRAGEWEFASYQPNGVPMMPPVNGAQCAACHRNAGANNDYVFRMRPTPGVP